MFKLLPFDDFVPQAPRERGEQVKVQHENCENGVDAKQRLFIKREDDGTILAYCHNCGRKGVSSTKKGRHSNRRQYRNKEALLRDKKEGGATRRREITLPSDSTWDTRDFPPEALVFLYKYDLLKQEIKDSGIVYSPRLRRLVIPVYNLQGKLAFYQTRKVFNDDPGPKYYTTSGADKNSGLALYKSGDSESSTLVLVEDVVSAIRVSEFYDSLALLGVTLNFAAFNYITKNYNKFIIFLDDDNPTVKKQGVELIKKLRNHVPFSNVKVVHSKGTDPKEYSRRELEELLREYD